MDTEIDLCMAKVMKRQMERAIEHALNKFNEDTGLTVESISIESTYKFEVGKLSPSKQAIRVRATVYL